MAFGQRSSFWLRLCTVGSFVCYLFAGVSFALPPNQIGRHCAMTHAEKKPQAVKPGASCPLAHNRAHDLSHHARHDESHKHPHQHDRVSSESLHDARHGHECDGCHRSQSAQQIVMCPQGCCLLYPGEGEVVSIAKFLLRPMSSSYFRSTLERAVVVPASKAPEPFLAPPEHPPSVFLNA